MSDLENMVRIGKVNDIRYGERTVRVFFEDTSVMSGWLKVLKSPPNIPEKEVPQETEIEDGHKHEVKIKPWMPNIGDAVLCLYMPVFGGDGYVLGGI